MRLWCQLNKMDLTMKRLFILLFINCITIFNAFSQNNISATLNEYRSQIELPSYYQGKHLCNLTPLGIDYISDENGILTIKYNLNENLQGKKYSNPITVKVNLRTAKLVGSYDGENKYYPRVYFSDESGIEITDVSLARSTTEKLLLSWWTINTKSAPVAKKIYDGLYDYWIRYNPPTANNPVANPKRKSKPTNKTNQTTSKKTKSGKYEQ